MNVTQVVESFLVQRRREKRLSERTLRAYACDLTQFQDYLGDREIRTVSPEILSGFVQKLVDEEYRYASVRRKIAALKVFFRWALEEGVIDESPAARLGAERPRRRSPLKVLSEEEIARLLAGPKADIARLEKDRSRSIGAENRFFCAVRDNVILELLLVTGIRIGELVALDVDHVDLEWWSLSIIGRGEKPRKVTIEKRGVHEALVRYIELRTSRDLGLTALFVSRTGGRLSIYSIENIFRKYARIAGIRRHVTPHALRHTMATRLIGEGADLESVRQILGHASILSTKIYERLARRRRRQAKLVEA